MAKSIPTYLARGKSSDEESWISTSDLMAGLMLIFLFIAIAFIQNVTRSHERVDEIVDTWIKSEEAISKALIREFEDDLPKWGVSIDDIRQSLVIRFDSPDIQFAPGSKEIPEKFRIILEDFFPRYLKTLEPFFDKIEEVRIEGHTSSEHKGKTELERYFQNMELSQGRTRTVLNFSMNLPKVVKFEKWAIKHVTANGLSSSNLKYFDGEKSKEDKVKSRRVEFRIKTTTREQFQNIGEELGYEN